MVAVLAFGAPREVATAPIPAAASATKPAHCADITSESPPAAETAASTAAAPPSQRWTSDAKSWRTRTDSASCMGRFPGLLFADFLRHCSCREVIVPPSS